MTAGSNWRLRGPTCPRAHPFHSVVVCNVFPRKPEEIHDLPNVP